jgi:outer membrane protein assembly factor BamB
VQSAAGLEGSQFATSNLTVELERFDPISGTTTWTSAVGDARTLAGDTSAGVDEAVIDNTHLVVPNSAGGLVIDLENGQTRQPVDSDVLWCRDTREFDRSAPLYSEDSTKVTKARRSGVFRPCTVDGTDAPIPTTALPSSVSTSFGDELRVVALSGSVSGFLTPPVADSDLATDSTTTGQETTTSDPPAASADAPAVPDSVEQVWATTGFEPLTTVTLAGGVALLYGSVGSDLYLIAIDPNSGTELWRQRASAAGLAATTRIVVRVIDGAIAYLRPTQERNQNTQLVLADAATGHDVWVTEARWWTGLPQVCDDNTSLLCGWSYASKDDVRSVTATRVERSSGVVSVGPFDAPPADSNYETLFDDVVHVKDAPIETIGLLDDGALKWSAAVADLLGPGGTMNEGSTIGFRPGTPPIVYISAHLSWAFDPMTGYPPLDLAANQVTVGLNAETGAVIWREPGTWTNCRNLLGDIERLSTPGSAFPTLRCRYSGQLNSVRPGGRDELIVPTDLSVTLERVDLTTGTAIWSIPLGAQNSLAIDAPGLTMTQLDDHRMLLGTQVVDLDTGTVRAAAPTDVFWCPGRQTFDQSVASYDRTGSRFDRRTGGVAFPCDPTGKPTSTTPEAVPLAVSTVSEDGLRLVSTPSGVIAYRLPL